MNPSLPGRQFPFSTTTGRRMTSSKMILSNRDLLTLLDALDAHRASGEDALRVTGLIRHLSQLLGTDVRYEVVPTNQQSPESPHADQHPAR